MAEPVALIPKCAQCGDSWLPRDTNHWRLYFGLEEDLDEQPELLWFCPACAAAEFE